MANQFSFEESEQAAIIGTYSNALEKVADATKKFFEGMEGVCEKTKYAPILNLEHICVDFYLEEVRANVENYFNEWLDSEASLAMFIEKMNGGEEAEETAIKLQSQLQDEISVMFPSIEKFVFSTGEPKIKEENFDELKEISDVYKLALDDICDETIREIESKSDENSAFVTIKAPILSTFGSASSAFEELAKQFETVKEEYTTRHSENLSNANDVTETLRSQAESSGQDAFSSISNIFKL